MGLIFAGLRAGFLEAQHLMDTACAHRNREIQISRIGALSARRSADLHDSSTCYCVAGAISRDVDHNRCHEDAC